MTIHLHLIDPARVPTDLLLLDDAERQRASAFRFQEDERHWAACRCALRMILGRALSLRPAQVPLEIGPHGKPELAAPFGGTHFNLSHCRDLALVAIAPAPVGIDLEPKDRAADLLGCEETFCHPQEIATLPVEKAARATALLEIWTAKEAVLKAHGSGLLVPPQSLMVELSQQPGRSHLHPESASQSIWRLDHPALEGHSAFLSSSIPAPGLIYHEEFRAP